MRVLVAERGRVVDAVGVDDQVSVRRAYSSKLDSPAGERIWTAIDPSLVRRHLATPIQPTTRDLVPGRQPRLQGARGPAQYEGAAHRGLEHVAVFGVSRIASGELADALESVGDRTH